MNIKYCLAVGGVRVIAELRDVPGQLAEVCHTARFVGVVCLGDDDCRNAENVHGDCHRGEFPRPEAPFAAGEEVFLDGVVEMRVRDRHLAREGLLRPLLQALRNAVSALIRSPALLHAGARAAELHDAPVAHNRIDMLSALALPFGGPRLRREIGDADGRLAARRGIEADIAPEGEDSTTHFIELCDGARLGHENLFPSSARGEPSCEFGLVDERSHDGFW